MADSDLLGDDSALQTLKKVLKKEFGVETSALLEKVETYENKAANTTAVSLTLATATVEKLKAIVAADGLADSADTATIANFAEWFDGQIEDIYNQYLSDGRFATDTDDGGSTEDSGGTGN